MGLYEDVAEWVKLPITAEDGQPSYQRPISPAFEQSWEDHFRNCTVPSFGRELRQKYFSTLVGLTEVSEREDLGKPIGTQRIPESSKTNPARSWRPPFTFLAHGSYGATSQPVLDVSRKWQLQMEASPVRFFYDTLYPYLVRSVRDVAEFIGANRENVVLVTNVEVGMNAILRSIPFQKGDRIIAFDVTYTAVLHSVQHICDFTGAKLSTISMPLRLTPSNVVKQLIAYLENDNPSPDGKIHLAVFQHITSPSAIVLPIGELIRICRQYGIMVMVDGAHTIGQIPLNLEALGADFYVSNAHKWLCSARGCAILYCRPEHHHRIFPLTTTWGHANKISLLARFIWQGTADYSPYLSLPTAIQFHQWASGEAMMKRNRDLALWCGKLLSKAWGTETLVDCDATDGCGVEADGGIIQGPLEQWERTMTGSMCSVRLPPVYTEDVDSSDKTDMPPALLAIADTLFREHNIEVPAFTFRDKRYIRVSLHMYNDEADCVRLGQGVIKCLGYPASHPGWGILTTAGSKDSLSSKL
ncbi:pyridoxal phosphate-dependent transferase [Fimicolochytrium jonesii]|uniref:pyridoxal phosphate-dependent transferase n=1 Tax=Fimicolochytrium jonesii TaxID=1396493 RepID=UPI0022FE2A45|nr:pyridoxal phosphate-dependent transferase [Fimicolochytrium jonesii]KAI8823637.1 pyridoxal phosphate-dependent transferase [Fimicolochytrium jonesii]